MRTRALGTMVVVVATAATMLAGCAPAVPAPDPGPTAELIVRSGTATVAAAASGGEAVEAASGAAVLAGDVVTTAGDDAMVDVAWSDGAVTRLGPDTVFTVGDPATALGSRGAQDGGVTWNRAAEDYAIDVVGTGRTQDRGELFVVDCRSEPCRVRASGGLGGDGSLTSLRRTGVETVVDSARLATWSELMSEDWAVRSAVLDEEQGLTPVEDLFDGGDPSRGVLEGAFDVVRTGTGSTCSGALCSQLHILQEGEVRDLTFVFHVDCPTEDPCEASVDTQTINTADGSLMDDTTQLVAGAESYTWGTDNARGICTWGYADGSTEEVGSAANVVRWEVRPTAAEVIDGRFVVTELTGSTRSSLEIVEPVPAGYPGCEQYEVEWAGSSDLVLTRRAG